MIFFAPGRWWGRQRFASLIPSGWCLSPFTRPMFFDAPCKLLCIKHLTEIRVMVFTTLKMPKPLLLSGLQVAFLVSISVNFFQD